MGQGPLPHERSPLWALVEHANHRRWPMLSAMIVNKNHRATGEMEPETLAGFTAAAETLRYEVSDPVAGSGRVG